MAAGPREHDGHLMGNGIQILSGRHALHILKQVLVPPASDHPLSLPRRVLCDPGPDMVHEAGEAVRMRGQLAGAQHIPVAEQMHMGVIESRCDKGAVQVHAGVCFSNLTEDLLCAPCPRKLPVFHQESLAQGQLSGVHGSMDIGCLHGQSFPETGSIPGFCIFFSRCSVRLPGHMERPAVCLP